MGQKSMHKRVLRLICMWSLLLHGIVQVIVILVVKVIM